jgi:orotidine-5'-phosphate decarboxylase
MFKRFIEAPRSVMVAVDVPRTGDAIQMAIAVKGIERISSFKLGIAQGLNGLSAVVSNLRRFCPDKRIVYDHQKAGNDIPEMGGVFAKKLKSMGCDAVILFPFAGPKTQRAWTEACLGEGLHVMVGGIMTHEQFLVSEGGYISDDAPERIFDLACSQGVHDFVVPGTKINWVRKLRQQVSSQLGEGNYDLYAPGFITQGGDISECGASAGPNFHAIVGSAIYGKEEIATVEQMRASAEKCTSQIVA